MIQDIWTSAEVAILDQMTVAEVTGWFTRSKLRRFGPILEQIMAASPSRRT